MGEERVAPRREQRQIEMSHGSEARGKHDEVPHVAAEREAGPRGAFENQPFPADERGGVAAARVGDGGDNVREDHVRQVMYVGGGGGGFVVKPNRSSRWRSRHGKRLD